jgi:hypothetical protein
MAPCPGRQDVAEYRIGYGLWYYDETDGWQLLNGVVPEDMKPVNFYP